MSHKVGTVYFTPHKLPCSYGVLVQASQTRKSHNTTLDYTQTIFHDNGLLALDARDPKQDVTTRRIFRMDLAFTNKTSTYISEFYGYYSGQYSYGGCQTKIAEKKIEEEKIESLLLIFNQQGAYDGVKKAIFKGKQCRQYYLEGKDFMINVYVDDDDYIIGSWQTDGDFTLLTAMSYKFNISMDAFALNPDKCPGCSNEAYVAPKDQCK